jgi:uncharacterized protein YndB with AHSA1/START domain/DNA-binding transcriptional ArsR family regulator
VEAVFKALADPTRRRLLDRLFERDGRTLGDLTQAERMTRFGVAKHLQVLEDAGVITTRRSGREKLHYLNPVPIQEIHDRWISKYAAPFASAMTGIKRTLEGGRMPAPRYVYEIYIQTTADRLWHAITDPDETHRYFHETRVLSDWKPGSSIVYRQDNGNNAIEGEIIECDAPHRLVHTFHFAHDEEGRHDAPTRVTWEITPMGDVCRLTLTHEDFTGETATYRSVSDGGWAPIIDSLKTLLETGKPMPMPAA